MKHLSKNIVPIFFILLAGIFVFKGEVGWGWCVFAAIFTYNIES